MIIESFHLNNNFIILSSLNLCKNSLQNYATNILILINTIKEFK